MPVLLLGMSAYEFLWTLLRVTILLLYGWTLGVHVHWSGFALGLPVLLLLCVAYYGLGLVLAAMFLAFRTIGPCRASSSPARSCSAACTIRRRSSRRGSSRSRSWCR